MAGRITGVSYHVEAVIQRICDWLWPRRSLWRVGTAELIGELQRRGFQVLPDAGDVPWEGWDEG